MQASSILSQGYLTSEDYFVADQGKHNLFSVGKLYDKPLINSDNIQGVSIPLSPPPQVNWGKVLRKLLFRIKLELFSAIDFEYY